MGTSHGVGQFWTPITPDGGSIFHADQHPERQLSVRTHPHGAPFHDIGKAVVAKRSPLVSQTILSHAQRRRGISLGESQFKRSGYETLQDAYRQLRDELETWNRRALDHGASTPPYEREVADLDGILAWGDEQLAHASTREITVKGIFVGSSRYAKAALTLLIHRRREDRAAKSEQRWPDATLRSLDDAIERIGRIADIFEHEPSDVLWQLIPNDNPSEASTPTPSASHWDVSTAEQN